MQKHTLPKRFWLKSEFPEGEQPFRRIVAIKSADFAKYYNKEINALLKKEGFKSSGMNALKKDEQTGLHYILNFSADKYGGCGYLTAGVHPSFLPSRHHFAWDTKPQIHQFSFVKKCTLPNGNREIDLGYTEEEVLETLQYVWQVYQAQGQPYFEGFYAKLQDFLALSLSDFKIHGAAMLDAMGFYTESARKPLEHALLAARLHAHYQNKEKALDFVRYGYFLNEETAAQYKDYPLVIENANKYLSAVETAINE